MVNSILKQQCNQNFWGPKWILQLQKQHCPQSTTDLCIMQCSRPQLYLSQWGKYFHKTFSLWSFFQLKSVSLTRGQRELQDSCCWRINVLNETWDRAAGIEDHHWKTLSLHMRDIKTRFRLYLSWADAVASCFTVKQFLYCL